jgi:hypothetical protein
VKIVTITVIRQQTQQNGLRRGKAATFPMDSITVLVSRTVYEFAALL